MSASEVTLLIVGLSLKAVKRIVPDFSETSYQKITESMKTLDNLPKLSYKVLELDDQAPTEAPNSYQAFTHLLKNHDKAWSAVLIGGGIRVMPKFTSMLEDMVNTVSSTSSGRTKILFSVDGSDHLAVVTRSFPQLKA